MSRKKKTFVLDTNVLLSDTDALNSFDEHDVVIPLAVLEELDAHKNRQDEVGKNARFVSRKLDEYRQKGKSCLSKGVKLHGGGTLKVLPMSAEYALPPELAQSKTDNAIIGFALNLSKTIDCTLVSKDINVRIKCDSLGLKSEDYLKMRVASAQDEIFGGVAHLEVEPRIIDGFYGGIPVSLGPELEKGLCPNQILVMKDHARSAIGKFIGPGEGIGKLIAVDEVFGLKPRNKEQCFALDLLLDDNIKLVSITGAAGCGKTLLSLAAGLQQVVGKGAKYEHLVAWLQTKNLINCNQLADALSGTNKLSDCGSSVVLHNQDLVGAKALLEFWSQRDRNSTIEPVDNSGFNLEVSNTAKNFVLRRGDPHLEVVFAFQAKRIALDTNVDVLADKGAINRL
jgi:PhoH-like ATPase